MADNLLAVSLALSKKIIDTEMEARALRHILIEKGIATEEEISDKYKFLYKRDSEKLNAEISDLIMEYAMTIEGEFSK